MLMCATSSPRGQLSKPSRSPTVSLGLLVQAVQVLQHSIHGNLFRSFEFSADTVSQHGGDQRASKPGQRHRAPRGCRSSRRHRHSLAGGRKPASYNPKKRKRGRWSGDQTVTLDRAPETATITIFDRVPNCRALLPVRAVTPFDRVRE